MQCRIFFLDKNLQNFDWVKLDESNGSLLESGSATADELQEICSAANRLTVFLPQLDILLTSVQMPGKVSKQQLKAIDYAVEDQLADDIDNCFFAITGQQEDGSVPVAVINRDILDDCVQLLSEQHVNAKEIFPPLYLCPWSEQEQQTVSVCDFHDGYLLRYGEHAGLFCHAAILPKVLQMIPRVNSSGSLNIAYYGRNIPDTLQFLDYTLTSNETFNILTQPVDAKYCINLKQKEYQTAHHWIESLKRWKWPAVAMSLAVIVFIASSLIDSWQKGKRYDELIYQQQSLLKQYLPDIQPGPQPKKQLIQQLADNQQGGEKARFLDMLHEFSRLKGGFGSIVTSKIQYQKSRLLVSLESKSLDQLESFRSRLTESSFSAQIDNVNISPEQTTGRLVMQVK